MLPPLGGRPAHSAFDETTDLELLRNNDLFRAIHKNKKTKKSQAAGEGPSARL